MKLIIMHSQVVCFPSSRRKKINWLYINFIGGVVAPAALQLRRGPAGGGWPVPVRHPRRAPRRGVCPRGVRRRAEGGHPLPGAGGGQPDPHLAGAGGRDPLPRFRGPVVVRVGAAARGG